MKIIITAIALLICVHANSQTLSTDSLSIIIRTLQKQVVALQAISWQHVITFTPSQFTVVNTPDSLHQTVSINSSVISSAPPVDLSPVITRVTSLENKVAALKVTTVTTSTSTSTIK